MCIKWYQNWITFIKLIFFVITDHVLPDILFANLQSNHEKLKEMLTDDSHMRIMTSYYI